jgi:hypothetical protein
MCCDFPYFLRRPMDEAADERDRLLNSGPRKARAIRIFASGLLWRQPLRRRLITFGISARATVLVRAIRHLCREESRSEVH